MSSPMGILNMHLVAAMSLEKLLLFTAFEYYSIWLKSSRSALKHLPVLSPLKMLNSVAASDVL